ncbi:MAG: DUF58 domain-containing protein [Rudaea sp.]
MNLRTAASLRSRLLEYAERRLPALTRLKRRESLPIRLDRHRIYVLPTRFGLMFSAVLLTMLLGALNYNNNPALLLTFLLGAAAYQSVFVAFRALDRLELRALRPEPCHAGDVMRISLHFHIVARPRHNLRLRSGDMQATFDLGIGAPAVYVEMPTTQRGLLSQGRLRLSSEYPFGLFQVWSWLNPDVNALVYPRLEIDPPPLPLAGAASPRTGVRSDGDDLAALRDYRPPDPPRNIAWKASARHDELLVREFEIPSGGEAVLDFAGVRGLPYEARISRLAAWVCKAEAAHFPYRLILPDTRLGPALGADHRHACLRALALLPGSAS